MPQIKEYNQQVENQGPVRTQTISPDEIGNGAGYQALGKGLDYAGDAIYKRTEQDEITRASQDMSAAHAQFTQKLNDDIQKGTVDPQGIAQNFDDAVGQIGDNLSTRGGREFFDKTSSSMRSHFIETAIAGKSEVAAANAKASYESTLKNYSSALMGDPSSYKMAQENHDLFLDSLVQNGHLPAEAAAKLKVYGQTELAKSAVRGWMQLDPSEAKAQLMQGQWDSAIDGDVKKQLLHETNMAENAQRIEDARVQQAQNDAITQAQHATQNDFLTQMAKGQLSTKDILNSNLDPFGSGSKEQFLNLLKTHMDAKTRTDPAVFKTLFSNIHAADDDPDKITDENDLNQYVTKGQLSIEDLKTLRGEMQGKGTQEGKFESAQISTFMKTAEDKLVKSNPMLGVKDAQGEEQMARLQSEFAQKFQQGKSQGKSVDDMLNPDSPDYLGKLINKYEKSPSEIMQGNMKALQPKVIDPEIARKPGESAADYLKRTKKQ